MTVAWPPVPGARTDRGGRVWYGDNGYLAVMAEKRRRTLGTVVRLPTGRIAGD
jgi:hypothetical protein